MYSKMYKWRVKTPQDHTIIEDVSIPYLRFLAQQSTSFLDFISAVSQWLGITEQKEFFEQLVIVSIEVPLLSWKEIDQRLIYKKFVFTPVDKFECAKAISKKANTTLLPFLKAMKKYKDYPFKNGKQSEQNLQNPVKKEEQLENKSATPVKEEEQQKKEPTPPVKRKKQQKKEPTPPVKEEEQQKKEPAPPVKRKERQKKEPTAPVKRKERQKKEPTAPVKRKERQKKEVTPPVKRKAPQKKKPTPPAKKEELPKAPVNFEKLLENVDKTLPIDERVQVVLDTIGLKMLAIEVQSNLIKFVSAAIVRSEMNFNEILMHIDDIPSQDHMFIIIQLTQLLNSFAKRNGYDSLKPLTFLLEVQKAIVLETEIKSPKI